MIGISENEPIYLNEQILLSKQSEEELEGNKIITIQNNSCIKSISEEKSEIKNLRKGKNKDKIYTVKTVIDKNISTNWYNQKIHQKLTPSNDFILRQISNILNGSNLNTLTLRKLYGILSICFNANLSNIDIPNISQIIKDHFSIQKSTEVSQETKKVKRYREKKRILTKTLAEFMDGNENASLKACAIKIKQYCEENHLIHPSNAKLFTLDMNLQEIFPGRDSISRQVNEILAALRMSNAEIDAEQNPDSESFQNIHSLSGTDVKFKS
ncbi:SWIB domain protein [Cryptosporidium ryanae]|uniref:SWIB domain protein n=1 Tax=Cryptosporidium ryanae TaxID=515981 RepID=UPI00351A76C2|nr:SWIB domain protein [Cryptosporidium ryanae]